MKLKVVGVHDNGEIIQLTLETSSSMGITQGEILAKYPDQKPIKDLHVTLCESGKDILPIPAYVYLDRKVLLVSRPDKTSTYMELSDKSVNDLAGYIQGSDRTLHVSITNLTGEAHSSIAKVWDYDAEDILH